MHRRENKNVNNDLIHQKYIYLLSFIAPQGQITKSYLFSICFIFHLLY